jgi:hypothetical protein
MAEQQLPSNRYYKIKGYDMLHPEIKHQECRRALPGEPSPKKGNCIHGWLIVTEVILISQEEYYSRDKE